jgi:hypothetical protein
LVSALTALAALPTLASAAAVTGRAAVESGALDHPLGVAVEPSSPYLRGEFALQMLLGESKRWRLTYEGSGTRFAPEVPLDDMRHAFGAEWIRIRPRDEWTLSAGIQAGARRQIDQYRVYDHDEAYGYLSFKTYPHRKVMFRGWAGVRLRDYRDLPEESYLEPHAVLEAKRFGDDRTTLGVTARLGGKWFHDPAAPRVWGTAGTPVTSQLTVAFNVAKGLSERVGLRAAGEVRLGLRGFPYYVEANLYDSPLLDRYARNGPSAVAALKWLSPLETWIEFGAVWTGDDYGDILFADPQGGGATRRDTVMDLFASLERRLLTGGRGVILTGTVSWRDQDSNLPGYAWSGLRATAGVEWRF